MKPAEKNASRRREIKRELRDIARRPDTPGAAGRVQRLRAEYRRLVSAHRAPAPERSVAPPSGLTEEDAAAVATWPPELRARVQGAALSRVLAPWGRN
ncbi:hypothetical protein ACIRPU_02075 [Streptomyces sp. NPDC102259]|uniref:hypothetical protein n=1 Tax=Streptomyces sp. NPDC102259 TaxID=3366148 RepID=UPI0037FE33D9